MCMINRMTIYDYVKWLKMLLKSLWTLKIYTNVCVNLFAVFRKFSRKIYNLPLVMTRVLRSLGLLPTSRPRWRPTKTTEAEAINQIMAHQDSPHSSINHLVVVWRLRVYLDHCCSHPFLFHRHLTIQIQRKEILLKQKQVNFRPCPEQLTHMTFYPASFGFSLRISYLEQHKVLLAHKTCCFMKLI